MAIPNQVKEHDLPRAGPRAETLGYAAVIANIREHYVDGASVKGYLSNCERIARLQQAELPELLGFRVGAMWGRPKTGLAMKESAPSPGPSVHTERRSHDEHSSVKNSKVMVDKLGLRGSFAF